MSVTGISETLGAILTGGDSRRMGRDKALVEWHGMSLLERAAGTMTDVFAEVIVCGDPERHARVGLEAVTDRRGGVGPLAGLETAFERAGERSVFVLACDLGRVTQELIEHVMAEAGTSDKGAAPSIDGRVQPLCGFYRHSCRRLLATFLDEGGRRAAEFFGHIDGHVIELNADLPFFNKGLLLNLNRPEDLDHPRDAGSRQEGRRSGAEA